ncbi:putative FAD-binding PCMH-type domain-containing protein [Seiridium unicorne]|uniref:FAD-binding PCMH-type domain-containing protein n=1 Tax=Seiridium unicorne TaxID=138068 RepID=A0ABR2ULK8_9PEZI
MRVLKLLLVTYAALTQTASAVPLDTSEANTRDVLCKAIPGDSAWPSDLDWAQLNNSVGGVLLATRPIAYVCHDPSFDEDTCASLKEVWSFDTPHLQSPADILSPYFQNQSCDPFTSTQKPCTLGNYASYSINVTGVGDIQAGIQFSRDKNIRLVLKNTGHDLLGKSTGKGALSLWLHNLNKIEFSDECSHGSQYRGPCVKLGGGVIFDDVYTAASALGLRIVGGTCPTVGISGGYTAGGGHGVFTSIYGMAADNVLEWEVVTADGSHLFATPDINTDLYWALSGGGPGTFAVVVSMTMRVYLDAPMSAASLSFSNATVGGVEEFWRAVTAFHTSLLPLVSSGATSSFSISQTSLTAFNIAIPKSNTTEVNCILRGINATMAPVGVISGLVATQHTGFLDMYNTYLKPVAERIPAAQIVGGRLIPRSLIEGNRTSLEVTQAFRFAVEAGFNIICVAIDARKPPQYGNSVFPIWRSSLMTCLIQMSWDFDVPREVMLSRQTQLTDTVMPRIEAATPGGGAYLNEASFQQADWEETFYGANYPRLSAIKTKYDPESLFYAETAVGSEAWSPDSDGRLCRL